MLKRLIFMVILFAIASIIMVEKYNITCIDGIIIGALYIIGFAVPAKYKWAVKDASSDSE